MYCNCPAWKSLELCLSGSCPSLSLADLPSTGVWAWYMPWCRPPCHLSTCKYNKSPLACLTDLFAVSGLSESPSHLPQQLNLQLASVPLLGLSLKSTRPLSCAVFGQTWTCCSTVHFVPDLTLCASVPHLAKQVAQSDNPCLRRSQPSHTLRKQQGKTFQITTRLLCHTEKVRRTDPNLCSAVLSRHSRPRLSRGETSPRLQRVRNGSAARHLKENLFQPVEQGLNAKKWTQRDPRLIKAKARSARGIESVKRPERLQSPRSRLPSKPWKLYVHWWPPDPAPAQKRFVV